MYNRNTNHRGQLFLQIDSSQNIVLTGKIGCLANIFALGWYNPKKQSEKKDEESMEMSFSYEALDVQLFGKESRTPDLQAVIEDADLDVAGVCIIPVDDLPGITFCPLSFQAYRRYYP